MVILKNEEIQCCGRGENQEKAKRDVVGEEFGEVGRSLTMPALPSCSIKFYLSLKNQKVLKTAMI